MNQQQHCDYQSARKRNAPGYVAEHVVTHLVPDDKHGLRRRHLCDGRIPDDYPLRGAETRDIRIDRVHFLAGFHLEHSLPRDV